MRPLLLFIILLFNVQSTLAGNENYLTGARSSGMAHASVTLYDVWSANQNQAGLAYVDQLSAGLYYENRFLLKETGIKAGVVAIPTKSGTFGVSVVNFGYKNYNEGKYGIAYGRKLGENVSAGLQLNYISTFFGDVTYGRKNGFTAEIGVRARIVNQLFVGAHIYNITRTKLADYNNEYVPTVFRLGMEYRFSEKTFLVVEAQQDIEHRVILKTGFEYGINSTLYLRGGVATNPFSNSFGVGLKLKNLDLDISSAYHYVLGFSPQVSLSYKMNKKIKEPAGAE